MAITALVAIHPSESKAGATFKIDDTKWVSVGAGLRSSFSAEENGAPNGTSWSNNFNLDNIRLYINGQVHKYLKVEFNTDCQTCNNGGEVRVLDAIGKIEVTPMVNLWIGRMLVPAERREMNGPFYSAVYTIFANGTPFEPADQNLTIGPGSSGSYGRDDGATIWGAAFSGHLQYAFGFFRGLRSGTLPNGSTFNVNTGDNPLYAQRVAYNFWEVEKNPGYYTSGTYYGTGGDILTVGVSNQYQQQGAGNNGNPANFRGTAVDVLMEKVLPNSGVVTFNGEYKNYGLDGYTPPLTGFTLFQGNAVDVSGMYLFPQKVGPGKMQPFGRYVNNMAIHSPDKDIFEGGVNYVIDGHNARVSLTYQRYLYNDMNGMNLGFQWQI